MKPAPFRYVAARSVDEAVGLLAEHGPEAKVLAGGQSLVPLMNFRLVRPAWLVDLNRVPGLSGIARSDGELVIGSMTRQAEVEGSRTIRELVPLISETVPFIGHPAIRNRGTVGGSLAHADPAAELPVAMLALDATMRVQGPAGAREVPAEAFFVSLLTTALGTDEILTSIRIGALERSCGWAFLEFARRHGDFALVAVAVTVRLEHGRITDPVRLALGGIADRPIRARGAEALLRGARPAPGVYAAASSRAAGDVDPPSDIHGSADYRRHLTRVFVERALAQAVARAAGATPS